MGFLGAIRHRSGAPHLLQQRPGVTGPTTDHPPSAGGFAVVDVETTGLTAVRDRVVEVAVVTTDPFGRIVDEWATLVDPERPMAATRIHGITSADVRRAPRFADIVGEINARLAGQALVAHNAQFDLGFLSSEYERAGWTMPACPHLCTLDASWTYLPGLDRRRLADCCAASGVRLDGAHTALGDARATARLLQSYLDPDVGRPPLPDHLRLPARARRVVWPEIPRRAVGVAMRGATGTPTVGRLSALLDGLALSGVAGAADAPATTTAYLELLAGTLEDGVLTGDEAASLADLARTYRLTREQVEAAHRGFLRALAHRMIEGGTVSRDERPVLSSIAAALGVTDRAVKAILDEARTARAERLGRNCQPLPASWPHGEPLRIDDRVAFTGCDELLRARLEDRARAAGLRVTSAVSGKTAVLVTDGAAPWTTKAQAARRFKTRTVTPEVFAKLLHHVQPAVADVRRPSPKASPHDQRPPAPQDED